jgi:glycosyltransferase involved in cell wall biosynthesis
VTTTVHQFVPNFAAGDAIGTHVRHTQRILRAAGFRSEVFYDDAQAAVRKLGRHWSTFDVGTDGDGGRAWVMFQLSTGSDMTGFLLDLDLPYGVYFHNITPPSFFERWEPGAAENLRRALADMRRLAPRCRFAMANSTYSERELVDAGYSPTAVVPVLVDDDAAGAAANANAKVVARLERQRPGARWVFVGRIAPNKCQHDIVAALAAHRELYDPHARLSLVGGRTSNVYYRSLELLADELGVADAVELTDTVPDDEKLAHLQAADVYVCLSRHEGFNVPVVEAMRAGIPVVALASSALPETVGDAGVLLPSSDAVLVATAVDRVLHDDELRGELQRAAKERLDRFSLDTVGRELLAVVRSAVDG